ncbi:hypothetical protein PYW08_012567 [Mythimna loreyi]|uniref:Uncharacterized protein n=1 Tax=Mythimna loreyi TaxID=667449 RepID=A0ACC2Q1T6_9NEOP|nr:hypothetical protein PYW08_012567 [Mythimna loreyi]
MQTTVKKASETKPKREKLSKDDATKMPQEEKLKKTPYTVSTPRNFMQKSSTADIYGQKKKTAPQSAKAPKKTSGTSITTNNASPMKDLLKSSPSTTSQLSTRSDRTKMATPKFDAKGTRYSATPRTKDFSVAINSPVVKRKLNMDFKREDSFVTDISKERKQREKSFIRENLSKVKEKSFVKEASKDKKEKSFIKEGTKERKEKSFIKDTGKSKEKSYVKEVVKDRKDKDKGGSKDTERQRTKTRTLDESEVKILSSEVVDNNAEMLNLSRKLSANPKAFYIGLDDEKPSNSKMKPPSKVSSDEDLSYEDDFESYESDFDSYHSSTPSDQNGGDETDDKSGEGNNDDDDDEESEAVETMKEVKDEENMLDSGSFDLRDRSANKLKPVALDFILETAEGGEKPSSLTDEGFQEMSSSSAVSSIRTVHTEIIDRPLFIDFTKSKQNRRKKRIGDRLRQRAKDLLSIITLHEMSYSLFEMKPISYDLYMATFGRSNYTQIAVQTFDDGISEEVQTDEIDCEHKWTQHPVEFTKNDICIKNKVESRKYSKNMEDYLTKFTFLTTYSADIEKNNAINLDENYKTDPLRIFFEQKDGVGPSEMLPYETYKSKLKKNDYNTQRLGKFLKRIEGRICNILNTNRGNTELSELNITNYPFSKGYVSLSPKLVTTEKFSFLNSTKISQMYFSETKSNLIMTVHKRDQNAALKKCTLCLWDISVATREPVKLLTAIDNVARGKLRGTTVGYFVAALEDGSVHLWDLSEEATWREDVASEEKSTELVEINEKELTDVEKDRLWNKMNSNIGLEGSKIHCAQQSCAFTNSAFNMSNGDATDHIVGLDVTGDPYSVISQEGGRRIVGQVVSLQSIGVLTIWSIVQQKSKTIPPDIGKAFWSKMKLEKNQTISLLDHIDLPLKDPQINELKSNFNLNAAKRRIINRKQEKTIIKKDFSRPKSAISFDSDRPSSAASAKIKRVLSVERDVSNWENGIICGDLKVMNWKDRDNYLVAKNCGEVLCCKRILGAVRVNTFGVASDASSVTCIEVSPHRLPYFLAATDTGTISVCSLLENRVLLTLDCRNIQPKDIEKIQSDHKGRYVSTVSQHQHERKGSSKELMVRFMTCGGSCNMAIGFGFGDSRPRTYNTAPRNYFENVNLSVTSLSWSHINPCCLFASLQDDSLVEWELTFSDIYAKWAGDAAASACSAGESSLALLTPEGEIQVHKLTNEHRTKEFVLLFEKYLALL